MTKRTRLLLFTLAFSPPYFLLFASAARAASPADEAAAETLFNQATEAAMAGRLDEACPKFAEAQRLDPTAGTLLNLGKCEEKRNNLATAYGAYVAAQALARQDNDKAGREARARAAATRLEPRLSMLVITVPQSNRAVGFEVKRNGQVVGEGQWGARIPIDPGALTIEVSAPGRSPWKTTVRIEPKPGSTTVEVPALAPMPVAPMPVAQTSTPRAAEADTQGSPWSTQKTAALAVGGAGVIAGALGAIFGVRAIGKKSDSEVNCQPSDPSRCNATGVALREEEKAAGTLSTVSFIAGGVALAGGFALFVTAPGRPTKVREAIRFEALPAVAGGDVGLTLRARW